MFDTFQEKLLKELDDPKIQVRILEIVARKLGETGVDAFCDEERVTIRKIETTCSDESAKAELEITAEREALRRENVVLGDKLSALQREQNGLKREYEGLKRERDRLKRERDELKKNATTPYKKVYDLYLALPNGLRRSLDGYFHTRNLDSFLFCGVQPENIRDYWDFCRTEFAQGRLLDHRDSLLTIFDFFFDLINSSLGDEPLWIKQSVDIGCEFDALKFSVVNGGRSVGKVKDVTWPGFLYAGNQKVCKKSLVVVA